MAGAETGDGNRELRHGVLGIRVSGNGSERTVALVGELDMANTATLAAELERAEEEGAMPITVDLRELEFIDSTGIAVLVAAHRRLNADGPRIRLVRSKASGVRRVMDLTGIDDELPFVSPGELTES
jgi:anti-sigma B factor antagonist